MVIAQVIRLARAIEIERLFRAISEGVSAQGDQRGFPQRENRQDRLTVRESAAKAARVVVDEAEQIARREEKALNAGRAVRRAMNKLQGRST